jgi:hypothetical protein
MRNGEFLPETREKINLILQEISNELERATRAYGPFNSPHEGYAVILEELDEMWDEIKANNFNRSKEEVIQVAAMCVRYLMDIRTE